MKFIFKTFKFTIVAGGIILLIFLLSGCGSNKSDVSQSTEVTNTVEVQIDGQGQVVYDRADDDIYVQGSVISLTAIPADGYYFDSWQVGGQNASGAYWLETYQYTVTEDATLVAVFTQHTVGILLEISGDQNAGEVYVDGYKGQAEFIPNQDYTVVAVANTGYTFDRWVNGTNGEVVNDFSFTIENITSGCKWIAYFTFDVTIQTAVTGEGSVTIDGESNDSKNFINTNESVSLVATPQAGYIFKHWLKDGDIVSVDSTFKFDVIANSGGEYTAVFVEAVTITLEANNAEFGSVAFQNNAVTQMLVEKGADVTLVATPVAGYSAVYWYKDGAQFEHMKSEITIIPTADATYKVEFLINNYDVVLEMTGQGEITINGEYNATTEVEHGTEVTLTATAAENYEFTYWSVKKDGDSYFMPLDDKSSEQTVTIEQGVIYRAVFTVSATTAIDRIINAGANTYNDIYETNTNAEKLVIAFDTTLQINSLSDDKGTNDKVNFNYSIRLAGNIDFSFDTLNEFFIEIVDEQNNTTQLSIMYKELQTTSAELSIYIGEDLLVVINKILANYVGDTENFVLLDSELAKFLLPDDINGQTWSVPSLSVIANLVESNLGVDMSFLDFVIDFPGQVVVQHTLESVLGSVMGDDMSEIISVVMGLFLNSASMFYFLEDVDNIGEYVEVNLNVTNLLFSVNDFLPLLSGLGLTDTTMIEEIVTSLIAEYERSTAPKVVIGTKVYFANNNQGKETISNLDIMLKTDGRYQAEIYGNTIDLPQNFTTFSINNYFVSFGSERVTFQPRVTNNFTAFGETINFANAEISGTMFLENGKAEASTGNKSVVYRDVTYTIDLKIDLNVWAILPAVLNGGFDIHSITWSEIGFLNLRIHEDGDDFINILIDSDKYGDRAAVVFQPGLLDLGYITKETETWVSQASWTDPLAGYWKNNYTNYNLSTGLNLTTSYGVDELLSMFLFGGNTQPTNNFAMQMSIVDELEDTQEQSADVIQSLLDTIEVLEKSIQAFEASNSDIVAIVKGELAPTNIIFGLLSGIGAGLTEPTEDSSAIDSLLYNALVEGLQYFDNDTEDNLNDDYFQVGISGLGDLLTFDVGTEYDLVYDGGLRVLGEFYLTMDTINIALALFGKAETITLQFNPLSMFTVTEQEKEDAFQIMQTSYQSSLKFDAELVNQTYEVSSAVSPSDLVSSQDIISNVFGGEAGQNAIFTNIDGSATTTNAQILTAEVLEWDYMGRPTQVKVYYGEYSTKTLTDTLVGEILNLLADSDMITLCDSLVDLLAIMRDMGMDGMDMIQGLPIGLFTDIVEITYV